MLRIKVRHNNEVAEGILLCCFTALHERYRTVYKRLLWRKREQFAPYMAKDRIYVVFIPWKHREKEIAYFYQEDLVDLIDHYPAEWVRIDAYTSKTEEDMYPPYLNGIAINDYCGYEFIYQNNEFACNIIMSKDRENLAILYDNLPEILSEEFDEEENLGE